MKLDKFLEYNKKITDLKYMANILEWDLQLQTPSEAKSKLIELITELNTKMFTLETSDDYGKLLEQVLSDKEFLKLPTAEQIYLKRMFDSYLKYKRVPSHVKTEYTKISMKSTTVWEQAKRKNNYQIFKSYLASVIEICKENYRYIQTDLNLYDTMLEEYEQGMTSEKIDLLFEELKPAVISLVNNLKPTKSNDFRYDYSESELKECAKFLLEYIGFDFNRGNIGIYPHGFTTKICEDDIRIAFAKTNNPFSFVMTIIHEGGHGLVEQNLNHNLSRYSNAPIDNSYALHESQSRFYENILGRNKNFWVPIYDKVKELLKLNLTIDEFVEELNHAEISPLRTEADELTYCLHILIRYELERDLFSEKITFEELPEKWNKLTKEYLGIEVKNDNMGLMQDVHWAQGSFGYFPSYLLGSIYDGMFKEIVEENVGQIDDLLKDGEIMIITKFLVDKIYREAGAYNINEILDKFGKKELSPKPFIKYLEAKYK